MIIFYLKLVQFAHMVTSLNRCPEYHLLRTGLHMTCGLSYTQHTQETFNNKGHIFSHLRKVSLPFSNIIGALLSFRVAI